jgi:radical SAM superfamily enzyme YgiQ (UPF0313 family)
MRVLLVSANTEQINMPVLPMGLACVAAATESAGHDVHFLNVMARDNCLSTLEQAVESFEPEVIGISVRNIDDQCMQSPKFLLDPVRGIGTSFRKISRAPILLGGAGFSIFPQSTLAYLGADMGVCGEGEEAFVALLEKISNRTDLADVPGLVLPQGVSAPRRIRRLDELPFAKGSLSFPRSFNNQKIWLPFQTRRGCPMDCSYCSTAAIEGRVLRKRSVKIAVDSISRFVEAGFTQFFLVDNTFNLPTAYAKDFCSEITRRRLDIQWRCILYPWRVDEDLVERMARAGCVEVSFGFESGSREILRSLNKRFQPEEVRSISKRLEDHGIDRMGFLLLGGPGETKETALESLSFADSLELEAMKVTAGIRVYPHTKLFRMALEEGRIAPSEDLFFPTFYLALNLEGWLQETLREWAGKRPNWHT